MKRKYPSAQNSFNRRYGGKPLTNDKDWCKECGGYIETKWTTDTFPMPYQEHKCKLKTTKPLMKVA